MSDNTTWLLREHKLEDVIKTRRFCVNFEKSNSSRPSTHRAWHLRRVPDEGFFIHPNPNKFSGYVTVPMRLQYVLPMMRFLDKAREMKSQLICMTPTIYDVFACPHHFRKPGCSMKIHACLLHNQLDIINRGELGCGFIDQAFLLRLFEYSTPAQGVFTIQVKISKTPSVGIAKNLLFAREDIEEYKIRIPTSMTLLQNASSNIVSPCVTSNPR
jgi:hypothetical protein